MAAPPKWALLRMGLCGKAPGWLCIIGKLYPCIAHADSLIPVQVVLLYLHSSLLDFIAADCPSAASSFLTLIVHAHGRPCKPCSGEKESNAEVKVSIWAHASPDSALKFVLHLKGYQKLFTWYCDDPLMPIVKELVSRAFISLPVQVGIQGRRVYGVPSSFVAARLYQECRNRAGPWDSYKAYGCRVPLPT